MPANLTKYMSKITRQAFTHMHEIYAQYAKGNVTDTLHFNVYASACLFFFLALLLFLLCSLT